MANDRAESQKRWHAKNRDKILARQKQWRLDNKEKQKAYFNSFKDDFYTLYYLPEEHYIGITNRPKLRVNEHRSKGKHVLDYEVVATFKDKRDALDAEIIFHKTGYNGKNNNYIMFKND